MTRDEAVARIAQGLHFRVGAEAMIKEALEEARKHLEQGKTLPWFLKEEDAPLALVAGTSTVALPDDFIRADVDTPLSYVDSENISMEIPWRGLRNASGAYSVEGAGAPRVAVLLENAIKFFPQADIDYTLAWTYFKHSEALNENDVADHPWLVNCPDAIIGEAGARVAADIEDTSAYSKFSEMRNKGFSSLLAEVAQREATEGPMRMGANN